MAQTGDLVCRTKEDVAAAIKTFGRGLHLGMFELQRDHGINLIAGIDEAGRAYVDYEVTVLVEANAITVTEGIDTEPQVVTVSEEVRPEVTVTSSETRGASSSQQTTSHPSTNTTVQNAGGSNAVTTKDWRDPASI
jgi:hypothetical protein